MTLMLRLLPTKQGLQQKGKKQTVKSIIHLKAKRLN